MGMPSLAAATESAQGIADESVAGAEEQLLAVAAAASEAAEMTMMTSC